MPGSTKFIAIILPGDITCPLYVLASTASLSSSVIGTPNCCCMTCSIAASCDGSLIVACISLNISVSLASVELPKYPSPRFILFPFASSFIARTATTSPKSFLASLYASANSLSPVTNPKICSPLPADIKLENHIRFASCGDLPLSIAALAAA